MTQENVLQGRLNIEGIKEFQLDVELKFNWAGTGVTRVDISKYHYQSLFVTAYDLKNAYFLPLVSAIGKMAATELIRELLDSIMNGDINDLYGYIIMKRIFDMYYIINNEEDLNKQRLGKKRRDYLISLLGKYSLGIDSEYETAIKGLFSVHDAEDSGIGWVRQVCEDYKQEIEEEINHIRRC